MIRNWKMFGLSSLLTVALTMPASAGGEPKGTDNDALKGIEAKLDALKEGLKKSFDAVAVDIKIKSDSLAGRLDALEGKVKTIDADLEGLKRRLPASDVSLYPPVDKNTIQDLQNKLADMQQTLNKLQSSSRISGYAPTSNTGRVVLVNTYPEVMTFILNGRAFTVAPNMEQGVESVPAGNLTYELISPTYGRRNTTNTTIAPNQTLTLTAYRP